MPHAGESDGSRESVPCDVSITATSGTPSGGIAPRLSTKKRSYTPSLPAARLTGNLCKQNYSGGTTLFGFRFMKASPTTYVLHYVGGHVRREGPGLSFFYYM